MNDPLTLALAWGAGLLIGGVFFGGLWWTVRRALVSPHPAFWIFGSLLVRMGVALVGFYFVGDGHWERLLLCLVGFGVARFVVTRLTRPQLSAPATQGPEARHAP
jgi:F1F0 ATPase subunit 2